MKQDVDLKSFKLYGIVSIESYQSARGWGRSHNEVPFLFRLDILEFGSPRTAHCMKGLLVTSREIGTADFGKEKESIGRIVRKEKMATFEGAGWAYIVRNVICGWYMPFLRN